MKHIKLFEEYRYETRDMSYWTSQKSEDEYLKGRFPWLATSITKESELSAFVTKCIERWNREGEKNEQVTKKAADTVQKIALKYFQQFNTIDGFIINAMIRELPKTGIKLKDLANEVR
jgi:hypothetical protein